MSKCAECKKFDDCRTGSGLVWPCGAFVSSKPKTNAERIRAMSDEELARVLSSPCLGCVVKGCKLHNYGSYGCENAFLKWLQQPAEEDAG